MRYNPGPPYEPAGFSALKWLLITLVGVFLVQNILHHWFQSPFLLQWFSLSLENLTAGKMWTMLSYGILHSTREPFPWHLLLNTIFLYWFGREVQDRIGSERFLEAFVVAVFVGAVSWLGVQWAMGANHILVGASAGVFGIMALFCLFRWDMPMGFLFFPGTITGKHLLYIIAGFQLFFFMFDELVPGRSGTTAHSAHLGGLIGGLIYGRWFFSRPTATSWLRKFQPVRTEEPVWARRAAARQEQPKFRVNVGGQVSNSTQTHSPEPDQMTRGHLRTEVDRILDKINESGFGSLTEEEKRILDRAKELL